MTRHARFPVDIWRKAGHADVPWQARLMYVTLRLDETFHGAGVVRVPADWWAADAALSETEARQALDELTRRRFVIVNDGTLRWGPEAGF